MIKKDYTLAEWKDREDYYIDTLSDLTIPEAPTVKEVLNLTSRLDKLFTEASFEYAMLKRKESRLNIDIKNAEAKIFNIVKKKKIIEANDPKFKITERETLGLVTEFLEDNLIQGYNNDVYSLLKAVMDRVTFSQQVVKIIAEKKAGIISATAMLKIENSFSGSKEREYTD